MCNVVEVIVFVELLEKKSFIVDLLNVNFVVLFIDSGSFIIFLFCRLICRIFLWEKFVIKIKFDENKFIK